MKKILNIALLVMLVITVALVGAAFATGDTTIIGYNLVWAYILLGIAIASVVGCAVFGMLKSSAGLKKTLLSFGLVAVVIGAAWGYASGHVVEITDISNGGFFGAQETIITEASILVCYATLAGTIIAALFSEVMNTIK